MGTSLVRLKFVSSITVALSREFLVINHGLVLYFILFLNWQAIVKKRPSRNINVQNFWLYVFGMGFNAVAILVQDFDAVVNK